MHIIVHPTGRNSSEFSVPLKLRRAYTVLQIIQCPGSTPAEAPGVSKKIRTCTVNSLNGGDRRRPGRDDASVDSIGTLFTVSSGACAGAN